MLDTASDQRCHWMGLLARAAAPDLARLWAGYGDEPAFDWLRRPEIGMVMLRGRTGATGAPFNLGEMSVTRASLRLSDGPVGHAYVQGRGTEHARIAALVDALMQTRAAGSVQAAILTPLAEAETRRRQRRAAKAAATKVEFFTMVRGQG